MEEFLLACSKGDIDYVEKFLKDGGDYHYNNDQGFRECCRNGHIDLAKYLFDLGRVDIHYNSDEAFRLSYDNGHRLMAEWIYRLSDVPYLDYFNDDNDNDCDNDCDCGCGDSSSREESSFGDSDSSDD